MLPKAHIILKPQCDKAEEKVRTELEKICSEKLPEYAQPVGYKFRKEFPYTPIGKIITWYKKIDKDNVCSCIFCFKRYNVIRKFTADQYAVYKWLGCKFTADQYAVYKWLG